jgi:hypothetical protein
MNTAILFLLVFCLEAGAQIPFWLDGPDGRQGPYQFRDGERVRVGTNTVTLVTARWSNTLERLDRIVIPEVDLRQTTIEEAVRFLNDMVEKYDSEWKIQPIVLFLRHEPTAGKHDAQDNTATILGHDRDSELPVITLQARKIGLLETIRIICNVCALKFRVEGQHVFLIPQESSDGRIVEQTYDVGTNFMTKLFGLVPTPAKNSNGSNGTDRTEGQTEIVPWRLGPDLDLSGFFSTGRRWSRRPTTIFSPSSGMLTVITHQGNIECYERELERICGRPVTNIARDVEFAPPTAPK